MPRSRIALFIAVAVLLAAPAGATARCVSGWKLVGADTFRLPDGLLRSQGVTTDGHGWVFSWQGGLERTLDDYTPVGVGTIPPTLAVSPAVGSDGTNQFGDNHIGDIDHYGGTIYAPVEDGGQDAGVVQLNDPEYQQPHIALYDAQTLAYT